jgi:type VI protein secretion system component Hcp
MRLIGFIIGTFLLSLTARAGTESFYMNIPGIKGESVDKAYAGWIPVTSFSEGFVTSSRGGGGATGRSTSRLVCQALQVVKQLDSSSAAITAAVATGQVFHEIDLVAVTAGGDAAGLTFLKFALHNAVISSVTFGGDSSTSARVETVSVSAPKVEVTYWPQSLDGKLGAPLTATVDCFSFN